jgi:energy-coupling factor transport system ATP-binding protein
MTLNSIDVKHLKFKYDDNQDNYTLDDLSFHVKQGEWLSIIGHNGSGKSTTVRLIDGLLAAESGDIFVENELLTEENVWNIRQKIGMVFQNPDNQFVGATVEDDVAFGLENHGVERDEMIARIEEALEQVRMTEYKKSEPARLSGGQKQRVAIAGVLALRPEVIILDEATAMLDPVGRKEVIAAVKAIKEKYNLTVISITHDIDEASNADRIIVMNQGKLVRQDDPYNIFILGDELIKMGLDIPFAQKIHMELERRGIEVPKEYLSEEELFEWLTTSYLTK